MRGNSGRKGRMMTQRRSVVLRILPVLFVLVTFAVASSTARAQSGSGTVIGTVVDQTGNPIKGVRISAKSDTQIGGAKTVYTADDGTYRMVGLIPGSFEVTATAPKLKAVVLKDLRVGVIAPAEADLVMEVETGVEEVKVVAKPPVISTTSAAVKESLDEEFVDNLPSEFKLGAEAVVASAVPGAVQASTRNVRMRGGASNHTAYFVEGFDMIGQRSTLKGMATIDVQTAGYGAEYAHVPGGVVNMVTKSGSNKFELDVAGYAEDNKLQFFLDDIDSRDRAYFYIVNPNVSGPIIKDKLWYFVNVEARREQYTDIADPLGIQPRNPDRIYGSFRGSGKFTWQITPRNKLVSFNNFNIRQNANQIRGYAPAVEVEAQRTTTDNDYFTGLIWESLLTDTIFFKSQIGIQRFFNQVAPEQCRTNPDCGNIPAIVETVPREIWSQNPNSFHTQLITDKLQFINQIEMFPSSKRFGDHDIKIKNDFETQRDESAQSFPGDRRILLNAGAKVNQIEYFSNDPRDEEERRGWFIRSGTTWRNLTSISDTWKATRHLTITPGVAVVKLNSSNNEGQTIIDALAATPHLAVAWDATHDGRTVVRGSFNNYLDVDGTNLARFAVESQVSRQCGWDAASQTFSVNCTYAGGVTGRTIGRPCGPTGLENGVPCETELKVPRTWEYTVGAEREVIQGLAMSADFVYRKYTNPYEVVETNRIWNASGSDYQQVGKNGRAQSVQDLETPSGAKREYLGGTFAVTKREGRLKINAAYTLSFIRGNVLEGILNAYGDIAPRDQYLYGYSPDDSRHNFRTTMTYEWARWLSTGLIYDYRSGVPYQRRFRNIVTGGFDDYRAPVGINPGNNLNDPGDDRPLRMPDIQLLSLQTRVNWKPLLGIQLETYVDVLNALALRTTTTVQQNDGPDWGSPQTRLDPFRLRIGFRYRY
jgi:hypothetical protein